MLFSGVNQNTFASMNCIDSFSVKLIEFAVNHAIIGSMDNVVVAQTSLQIHILRHLLTLSIDGLNGIVLRMRTQMSNCATLYNDFIGQQKIFGT